MVIKITQDLQADSLNIIIDNTYYDYWGIDESTYTIADNAVFITYRIFNNLNPKATLMDGFRQWYRDLIKRLVIEHGNNVWVNQRQPVGMYAMDYTGSRSGSYVDSSIGPHIHALLVVHPELKERFIGQLRLTALAQQALATSINGNTHAGDGSDTKKNGFHWEWYDPKRTIRDVIHYNLKGIMHQNGFYHGRSGQWMATGPDVSKPFVLPVQTPAPAVVAQTVNSIPAKSVAGISV